MVNIPELALAACYDAIWAGTSAVAYYSPETKVLTAVAHCEPNDLLSVRCTINGVQLFAEAVLYPNLPSHIAVWSADYLPERIPLPAFELVRVRCAPYFMPLYKQNPATFKDGELFLGDYVTLYPNTITEIILAS